ncbi:MAG TPA: DUF499 domain-containing protein [Accumulibacter sp.]|uniref:DUF499 domain-containing protein n=2 Tax=Accumulibacter sp. TaxID=2053492 RepID=UPI00287A0A52|nr:DUF499 domain-containing protein [Accumulibacter sp.]MDS4055499.1 DUF499 domain-containing protein [Accumulibacter sp.]HMW55556.1 DUF499 domain-containing protein [Accumulibacter sp.]HND39045.1 DUF499 domain-containing protein [Accumulibacter sp.]HNF91862.1 DUF499 domain-containing protein [Accumulibacter sp.]HNO13262.1 DUF499 domain-containing protein [Accumulibacter sp.]
MTLKTHCTPRPSVFDRNRRDIVLDLSDFLEGDADGERFGERFFEENFITNGMKILFEKTFARLESRGDQASTFLLTQSMGGGKTHNMIALGLLAKHPSLRERVLGKGGYGSKVGGVRVIGFHGRQTDAQFGIWGELADQLGKKAVFKDYYQPLQAPGQSAWINLLKGEPTLILLDELPFYLHAVQAKAIGSTTLSTVTATAIANLLVAVNKAELSNVCVVIADLTASWQAGGAMLNSALDNLKNETSRSALRIEPVSSQGEELYHILRTRLFQTLPDQSVRSQVASAYAEAVKAARQMDVTNHSPDSFAAQLSESYPFHFGLRDLYARFKENPGFQQTRGLIRLMRMVVSNLWETGRADKLQLIHPYNLDLNSDEIVTEIRSINPSLSEAISYDIANNGHSVAEEIDAKYNCTDAQDVSKLLLVSSLASVPNATHGLRQNDIMAFLCAPGRDISKVKKEIVDYLPTQAWYLHQSSDGRLFYKDIQNLAAKLHTTARQYNQQTCLKELRVYLEVLFQPSVRDCYQRVAMLAAIDEVHLETDRTALLLVQPRNDTDSATKLPKEWVKFHTDQEFKNRVLYLTGSQETLTHVLEQSAQYKAIKSILDEMDSTGVTTRDPQRQQANQNLDQITLRLRSAIQETFTTLVYPSMGQLRSTDCRINFQNNQFDGEKLIRDTLTNARKFETETGTDAFRRKCEERLFQGQKTAKWNEIKRRAAMSDAWPLHRADALDALKTRAINEGHWRDLGGSVEKGPFPPPRTEVQVRLLSRDDKTGEAFLKITPLNGDKVHYEIGNTQPTGGSLKVSEAEGGYNNFRTRELKLTFLCVDSTGNHDTGPSVTWKNTLAVKYRVFQQGEDWRVELRAVPRGHLRYTTNGADPVASGGAYDTPFTLPAECRFVLAVAEDGDIRSNVEKIDMVEYRTKKVAVDAALPAVWSHPHLNLTAAAAFAFVDLLEKHAGQAREVVVDVTGNDTDVSLSFIAGENELVAGTRLRETVKKMQEIVGSSQVNISATTICFQRGQLLLDWIAAIHGSLQPGEVSQ